MRVLTLVFLLVAMTLQAASQDQSSAHVQRPWSSKEECGFSEVYQQGGWKIPGLSGAVPKEPRVPLVFHTEGMEASVTPGIFATSLHAGKSDLQLTILQCSRDLPDQLVVRIVPVKVLEMWRLDLDGRVFAYGVRYEPQLASGGALHGSLEYVQVIFYDTVGSGHFASMRYQNAHLFQSLNVPGWAKRPSQ